MGCRYDIRQGGYVGVLPVADSSLVLLYHLSDKERHAEGIKPELVEKTGVDGPNHRRPLAVAVVCLSLVHQYASYDAIALGYLCHIDEAAERVVVIR